MWTVKITFDKNKVIHYTKLKDLHDVIENIEDDLTDIHLVKVEIIYKPRYIEKRGRPKTK